MNMKNCKRIFLTDEVVIKLTKAGINSLLYYYKVATTKDLKKILGKNLNLTKREFHAPLCDIINIFGDDVFMDNLNPFENCCIYIPEISLK